MRINESTFRKILREEARRTLNEAEGTPPAAAAIPTGGTGAVSGPPSAAASGALTAATAAHDAAFKAADEEGNRLVGIDSALGLKVKAGIYKLKDPKSPAGATLQSALSSATGRGTAQGVAGRNLILFATLATGKAVSDWKVAVKGLGYEKQIGTEAAKLDDPSKITNPDPALKSLLSLATAASDNFNAAVTKLIGTSAAVKAAEGSLAPTAGAPAPPAPGTAPTAGGPAKDWSGYNAKVKNGAAVNSAWTDFTTSQANTQSYNASFGSFVKFYNASIKKQGVKAISPDSIIQQLRQLIAAAGLTPVTPITTTPDVSLGGGALIPPGAVPSPLSVPTR